MSFFIKYTPQSNDLVERKNRTLIDMTRSMLSEYNVSQSFWPKLSTRLTIVATTSIITHWKRRHHMNSWMVGSPTLHIFGFLVANAISWRKAQDWATLTRNVMKDSYLAIPPQAKHIEFRIWIVVLLRKFMMLNLMKPRVHK